MLFTYLTPLIPYVGLLVVFCLIQGTALGIIDNIAQVLLIRLMDGDGGKEVQPYMQALHAAFGVGAFMSPLIISPFLGGESAFIDPLQAEDAGIDMGGSSTVNGTATETVRTASGSTSYHYAYYLIASIVIPIAASMSFYMFRDEHPIRHFQNWWFGRTNNDWSSVGSSNGANGYTDDQADGQHVDEELPTGEIELTLSRDPSKDIDPSALAEDDDGTSPAPAHTDENVVFRPPSPSATDPSRRDSTANLLAPVVIPIRPVQPLSSPDSADPLTIESSPSEMGSPAPSLNGGETPLTGPLGLPIFKPDDWMKWKMVLLIGLFLFLYVGAETGYGSFIFTYGIKQSHMDPSHAAILNSCFWFSFAVGRLLGIPISLRFSAITMIFSDLLGCIISVLVIVIFHDSQTVLWVGTIAYGLSVASIYPSAINYAETQFKVTGKVLSALVVSASCGEAVLPLVMGLSFESPAGPMSLMLLAMGVAVGAAIIFAVIVGFVAPDVATAKSSAKKKSHPAKRRRRPRRTPSVVENGEHSINDSVSPIPHPHPSPKNKPNRKQYAAVHNELVDVDLDGDADVDVDLDADALALEMELDAEFGQPHSPSQVELQSPIRVNRMSNDSDEHLPDL